MLQLFWRFLLQRNLGNHWLEGVHYAVFGLGDSGYQKYNFVAKKLDKRLSDLGATAIVERGLGDDQHPSGYEAALDPWMSSLWSRLCEVEPNFFPEGPDFVVPNVELVGQPKFQVLYHNIENMDSKLSTATDFKYLGMQIGVARSMSARKISREKSKPDAFLKMIENYPLTRESKEKDVRHFEFEFVSPILQYEIGDVLEVLPSQNPAAVDSFIKHCNLDPEVFITVHPRDMENHHLDNNVNTLEVPIRLRTFVELAMDVASASPRRYFFEARSCYELLCNC